MEMGRGQAELPAGGASWDGRVDHIEESNRCCKANEAAAVGWTTMFWLLRFQGTVRLLLPSWQGAPLERQVARKWVERVGQGLPRGRIEPCF